MPKVFVILLLLSSTSLAADPPKWNAHRGVVYATVEKESLKLELYVPMTPGPHPVVVCLHGGAWTSGHRLDLCEPNAFAPGGKDCGILQRLASNGYAAVSVSYRLAPKHLFPAQIIDVKTAVRFLRANAKKYDLDPERIAAWGYSAGGHLASLLGTTDEKAGFDDKQYPGVSSSVKCVVNFFGPCDLAAYGSTRLLEDSFMVPVLGKECKTNPAIYKKASPIEYATKASAPTLFIHGTHDIIVPHKQSEVMCKKLKDLGVTAELLTLEEKSHGWDGETAEKTAVAGIKFLQVHLKKGDK